MNLRDKLKIKIYADGANIEEMKSAYKTGLISGFTTNPTLMRKAGITDYRTFAQNVCREITDMPISFEVFSDDFSEMKTQAREIAKLGKNANVKIPITNTKGESSIGLIQELLDDGIKLNVTAIFTKAQIRALRGVVREQDDVIVSVFAGRIADTGVDPLPLMRETVQEFVGLRGSKVFWASPREVLNVFQADEVGVHIITVTSDIWKKLELWGKDLEQFSLESVQMFYRDAQASGFQL